MDQLWGGIKYDDTVSVIEFYRSEDGLVLFLITIKNAYHYHARGKSDVEKLYLRILLVTDYICGMTDSYAKRLYQELKAMI